MKIIYRLKRKKFNEDFLAWTVFSSFDLEDFMQRDENGFF